MRVRKLHLLEFIALIALCLVIGTAACNRQKRVNDYTETVSSGMRIMPWPLQIEKLFGEADHFITHYKLSPGPKTWNTEVFFNGRYELTLQVDVDIDYSKKRVLRTVSPPLFSLREVDRVVVSSSGIPDAYYSQSWTLDESRWDKVMASGGDWSAIGIIIKSNRVPEFERYEKAMREPRLKVR